MGNNRKLADFASHSSVLEESGDWTPVVGGANQSPTNAGANVYQRVGKLIFISGDFTITGGTGSNFNEISGLPYLPAAYYTGSMTAGYCDKTGLTNPIIGLASFAAARFDLYTGGTGRADLNNGDRIIFSGVYLTG